MKNHRRMLSLALALVMALALLPSAALAAETPERGVLTYTQAIAPQYEDAMPFSEGLAAVKKDGKWGYIDESGAVVIPFQFDRAYGFNEGYAIVGNSLGERQEIIEEPYSYDEETGEWTGTPTGTYQSLYELGFIDKGGSLTWFEETYYDWDDGTEKTRHYQMWLEDGDYEDYEQVFHNGYVVYYNDDPGSFLFDTTGKDLQDDLSALQHLYGWLYDDPINEGMAIEGSEMGYIGYRNLSTGASLTVTPTWGSGDPYDQETIQRETILRPFNQGLAPVWEPVVNVDVAPGGVWDYLTENDFERRAGFIDRQGRWVIRPQYTYSIVNGLETTYKVFGDTGLAMVADENGKWGGIDKAGNTVIPFEYDWLWNYYFGLCAFQKDGKWGFLDEKGAVAIPAQFEDTSGFSGDGYAVVYDGVNAYLINSKGEPVPGADSLDPSTYFWNDADGNKHTLLPSEYVVIQDNGKYGFGHVEYKPPLPEPAALSAWAQDEVVAAIEEDLVPNYLQNLYQQDITRDEFCDLMVQVVEESTGKEIEEVVQEKTGRSLDSWLHEYPFKDTTSSNVIAANALGIVNGRGDGNFDPYATITRQEAAALLMRGAATLGIDTSDVENANYTDSDEVGVWFTDAVNFVNQINVMNGTGNGQFTPLGTYSREQSYMTMHRLFQQVAEENVNANS